MLRVYSVLYLEKVWTRPDVTNICTSTDASSHVASVMVEEEDVESDTMNDGTTASLDLPPMPLPPQQKLQDSVSNLQQPQFQPQPQRDGQEESGVAGTFGTKSSESLQEYTTTDSSRSSISIAHLDTNLLPSPSRSETPLTDHSSVHSSKKIEPIFTNLAADREYYDDDISSDLDQESDDADSAVVKMDMTAAIKELPTPPTTPLSTKFSPKRILHRAKSSITDESVKKLGRRTSMFLEKFHYQQQEVPPLPPLPAKSTTPVSPPTPTTPSSLKSLRRQSSKLTNKGKTLSKKLRKVMSFHQTNQQQVASLHQ